MSAPSIRRRLILPALPADLRDTVRDYFRVTCSNCSAVVWIGPRQHAVLVESEGDAFVVCQDCIPRMPPPSGVVSLGNPDLRREARP